MNDKNRAVQVPVSLPTRKQIADAEALITEADGALSVIEDRDWTWQDTLLRRLADHYRATLARLSRRAIQSDASERTYTAADVQEAFERGCIRGEQDANERNWSRREYEKMQAPPPLAEPPRIEDLAPGTTFTGQYRAGAFLGGASRWLRDSHGVALASTGLRISPSDIDPSTIRDVQPPKDAA